MKIGIIVSWVNPNLEQTVQDLTRRGVDVTLIYPDEATVSLSSWNVEHDLYVLKSGTDGALSMAGALHTLGAVMLNPYLTVVLLRNKIIVTRALQQAGIPTPETFIASHPEGLASLLDDGPLIVKPFRGSRGEGVRVIYDVSSLEGIPVDAPVMAQRYHSPDPGEADRKIYCIGDQIFGVKRIWPLRTYQDKYGEPFTVSPELRDIAIRCGEIFGIDLYGLDVVISKGQPYVVDINKFGSFIGVPDAPSLLADYLFDAGHRASRGELVFPKDGVRHPLDTFDVV